MAEVPSAPGTKLTWRRMALDLGTLPRSWTRLREQISCQSQFLCPTGIFLAGELAAVPGTPHHPTPAHSLEGWTGESHWGLAWVTKRCSAHLTKPGFGQAGFCPQRSPAITPCAYGARTY